MNQHLVQFYENDAYLNEQVMMYIGSGLAAGDTCIVIAAEPHLRYIEHHLRTTGQDTCQADDRHCLLLNAAEILSQIMVNGWPDERRFINLIGALIQQAAKHGKVRIFGEMVALLCNERKYKAALLLEAYWNTLALHYSFSLLCAYPLENFSDESASQPFHQLCTAHTHVLPAESYQACNDPDNLYRTIAELQQKAEVLESEVSRRKHAEAILKQREQELSDFLENATEGLRRVGPDGHILWANKVEMNLLGYSPQEYIGQPFIAFHADRAVGEDMLARQLRGEPLVDYPARLRCKDGSIKHVLIRSNAVVVDGRFVSTRCFTRDVTDQVQLQQERHQRREEQQVGKVLRAANDELEFRVQERTARLQKSNALLTAEIAERKRAEHALQQSQQLLRELGQHTEKIIEEERKRIARELHDQLGQNLMALRIDVLMLNADAVQPKAVTAAKSALNNIDSMIKNVRAIINNLRPPVLDLGLPATIEWEVKEFERRSGIVCHLEIQNQELDIDDSTALALLRILQESLNNVLRHAYANRVEISLGCDHQRLTLRVADNGVGDFPNCRRKANAYGLLGIQERVSAFGGELTIETDKGKGLALIVSVPLAH